MSMLWSIGSLLIPWGLVASKGRLRKTVGTQRRYTSEGAWGELEWPQKGYVHPKSVMPKRVTRKIRAWQQRRDFKVFSLKGPGILNKGPEMQFKRDRLYFKGKT